MSKRIIYYYQTFVGLDKILKESAVTHIHLSSIHFGKNADGSPYIHLNDNSPDDDIFFNLWKDIKKAQNIGIKIVLMLGGAGGAYNDLFNNFEIYYKLLHDVVKKYNLDGIDLDIEESVDLKNIKMLINRINNDFGNKFLITMAPIQNSLENDTPGMGGFIYKELYNSKEGKLINYFNGQFYSDFSFESYNNVIENDYPPNQVVIGMISGQDFNSCCLNIKKIIEKYNNFGGVFIWEYFNAPPDKNDPSVWSKKIKQLY